MHVAIERLRAENTYLREALVIHGRHSITCRAIWSAFAECSCGYDAAVQALEE